MFARYKTVRGVIALPLLLPMVFGVPGAHADPDAAQACAAGLPKDARAIFDAALPQLTPDVDLRKLVTSQTRSLAMSGTIARGTARSSAVAAAKCLKLN